MLDESLLDAPEALARADTRGLLRGAAEAGARVRMAARYAAEAGIADLRPDGRPRAVLVAGPGSVADCTADLLGALTGGSVPVSLIRPTGVAPAAGALRWTLPGWVGPLDLLAVTSPDGSEPGLGVLIDQAYRRGCSVVAVCPTGTPLVEDVERARGLVIPTAPAPRPEPTPEYAPPAGEGAYGEDAYGDGTPPAGDPPTEWPAAPAPDEPARPAPGEGGTNPPPLAPGEAHPRPEAPAVGAFGTHPHGEAAPPAAQHTNPYPEDQSPGALWAVLTPLLALVDRIGLVHAPPEVLQQVADRLDQVAERCGPVQATHRNPAKSLAAELADALPLVWTEGELAGAVGRRFARLLGAVAGRPALAAELPDAMRVHGALLTGAFAGGADPDDFFRDRVDDPEALRARVVLLRDRPTPQAPTAADLSAAPAARDLALSHDTAISELEPTAEQALENAAELLAITDFAAVYLAIAGVEGS
ncbi:SIS domain-containing protein [Streptomyces sp. NPDC057702]|uniref:SIS domain-containing protein n=1 Tax=unclassified Streptomyces TaxID=2593676 RepID=UPI00367802A0